MLYYSITAFFALLILRPPKSLLKSKGLALIDRCRHHLTENFLRQSPSSQPKMGVIPANLHPDFRFLPSFAGFSRFIDAAPLSRSDLLPPE